jgi:hypothetical protein
LKTQRVGWRQTSISTSPLATFDLISAWSQCLENKERANVSGTFSRDISITADGYTKLDDEQAIWKFLDLSKLTILSSYALPLLWLAAVVLLLCPALYVAAGCAARNPVQAVLHSLEVVTFLKESGPNATSLMTVRFVEGERILSVALLGLFVPAIQRKFARR